MSQYYHRTIIICLIILKQVLAQTTKGDGILIPLLLKSTNSQDHSISCFDEDPLTGDRVYGGQANSQSWLGFKEAAKSSWYTQDWNWMWTDNLSLQHSCYEAHFTPDVVPKFGHKIVGVLLMSTKSSTPPLLLFIDQWKTTTPFFDQISKVYEVSPHHFQDHDTFSNCFSSSHMTMIGTDIHWWFSVCGADKAADNNSYHKHVQRMIFDSSSNPISLKKHEHLQPKLGTGWLGHQNSVPFFLVTPNRQKLYIAQTSAINGMTTKKYDVCISRYNYPRDSLTKTFSKDYEKQFCNEVAAFKCPDNNYNCIIRRFGPLSYYDKLVSVQYEDITKQFTNQQITNQPSQVADPKLYFVGECGTDTLFYYPIDTQSKLFYVHSVQAYNETTNFLFIQKYQRLKAPSTYESYNYPVIMIVHFDPDQSQCSNLQVKTPTQAWYLKVKYFHNGPLTLSKKFQAIIGHGAFKYSNRAKMFIFGGIQSKFDSNTGLTGNIGYAHGISIDDLSHPDMELQVDAVSNEMKVTHKILYEGDPKVVTSTEKSLTLQSKDYDKFEPYSTMFHKCYGTLKVKKQTQYNANSKIAWIKNPKLQVSHYAFFNDYFEVNSKDSDCQIKSIKQYSDIFEIAAKTALTFSLVQKTIYTKSTSIKDEFTSFSVQNAIDSVFSHQFQLTVKLHPCADPYPTTKTPSTFFAYNAAKYLADGTQASKSPEDALAVSTSVFGSQIVYTQGLQQCPLIFEIANITTKAGTSIPYWENYFLLDKTSGSLQLQNYYNFQFELYQDAKILFNVQSKYFPDNVIQNKHLFNVKFKDTKCNGESIKLNSTTKSNNFTIDLEWQWLRLGWDKKYEIDPIVKTIVLEMKDIIYSTDPFNCPIIDYGIYKVVDPDLKQYFPNDPSWMTIDRKTGTITIKDYAGTLVEQTKKPFKKTWEIYGEATTGYSFWVTRKTEPLKILDFKNQICYKMAFKTIKSNQKQVELWYNIYETSEKGITQFNSQSVAQKYLFELMPNSPVLPDDPKKCPILASRFKTDKSKDIYKDVIQMDDTKQKIEIGNYVGIDITKFTNFIITVEVRTEVEQSTPTKYIEINSYQFTCNKAATQKVFKMTEVKAITATYDVKVPWGGKPQVQKGVNTVQLDMNSGFFEPGLVPNCTLKNYKLAQVLSSDGKEIDEELWKEKIIFNKTTKTLFVVGYAGMDIVKFKDTRLMFHSTISEGKDDLTHLYHLVNVTITLQTSYDPPPLMPPEFASSLVPMTIEEKFYEASDFSIKTYLFPNITDPFNKKVLPIKIENKGDFDFIIFDEKLPDNKKLQVDPNKMNDTVIDSIVSLKIKLQNEDQQTKEYDLAIIINNIGAPKEEPKPEPEPEKPKETPKPVIIPFVPKFEVKVKEKPKPVYVPPPVKETDEWVRPPQPPELQLLTLGSKGELKLQFSEDIIIPDDFYKKFEEDKKRKKLMELAKNQTKQNDTENDERRLKNYNIFKFYIEGATNMKREEIPQENIMIESLEPRSIEMKVTFQNPEFISMSDQSIQDRIIVIFEGPEIYGKNGLPLSPKRLDTNKNGDFETKMNIQPMVNEESQEVQTLEETSEGIFTGGFAMMFFQFALTYILSASLENFWNLINSQINFVYIPLLNVNAPGQVSFYLDILIFVCTFDPIPMDIIYEILPFWSFDKINIETDRFVFGRIGLEDRNIVNVMGSLFLFVFVFCGSQLLYFILFQFKKKSRKIKKVVEYLTLESAYRTVFILFFLETYVDLTIGGMLNTENDYLLDDPSNWGARGMLTKSDQFGIIFGNFIYIVTQVFPFAIMFLQDQKFRNRYQNQSIKHEFDHFYHVLYEGQKTEMCGPLQYWSVYLLRKFLYCYIVFYFMDEAYTLLQIVLNLALSLWFALYLASIAPYVDTSENLIAVNNELAYYIVSLMYLCFTDFNESAEVKIFTGWFVIMVLILNLLWPNGYLMVKGMMPSIIRWWNGNDEVQFLRKRRGLKQLEIARKEFIKKNGIKLKKEFETRVYEEREPPPQPRYNQVVDAVYFDEINPFNRNTFEVRRERRAIDLELQKLTRIFKDAEGYDIKEIAKNKMPQISEVNSSKEISCLEHDYKSSSDFSQFEMSGWIKQKLRNEYGRMIGNQNMSYDDIPQVVISDD